MTGGRSWNALTVQCLPNAARDFWLRIVRAVVSSISANTSEDLGVERSSSSVRSHRGLAAMSSSALAYVGLQVISSEWTASAVCWILPFPIERDPVLTPSICILYHFLSSRMMSSCLPLMSVSTCENKFWNFSNSSAVWSDRVERIRFPWLLKPAATTFMWLAWGFCARVWLMLFTMMLGSGLSSGGIPFGLNWMTSLEGW